MICCAASRLLVSAVVIGLVALPASARKDKRLEKEDLINVLLGPARAQWLVGPIASIATDEEIQAYLELSDDTAAEDFILEFWQRRVDPGNPWPGHQVKDIFDIRAERADRLFTEGASPGRRTDRGSIFILFGEPKETGFVQDVSRNDVTVEVWLYDPSVRLGLHGEPPQRRYFFSKKNGVMSFASPPRILQSRPRR